MHPQMSPEIDAVIEQFRGVEKSPTRVFSREKMGNTTIYGLPNGISVCVADDGATPEIPFPYELVERTDRLVVVRKLSRPRK